MKITAKKCLLISAIIFIVGIFWVIYDSKRNPFPLELLDQLSPGMTQEKVLEILGEPYTWGTTKIRMDHSDEKFQVEVWDYSRGYKYTRLWFLFDSGSPIVEIYFKPDDTFLKSEYSSNMVFTYRVTPNFKFKD